LRSGRPGHGFHPFTDDCCFATAKADAAAAARLCANEHWAAWITCAGLRIGHRLRRRSRDGCGRRRSA